MDIALIIGVVLGMVFMIGSIAYALFVEGAAGGFGNFVSIPSFGIVIGGMIASVMVAFPMYHVAALGKAIGAVLKPADDKMGPLVDEACDVAEYARKGPADLEKSVDTIKTYFFKDGVQMVVDGYSLEFLIESFLDSSLFSYSAASCKRFLSSSSSWVSKRARSSSLRTDISSL